MKLYYPKAKLTNPNPHDFHKGLMYTYDACNSLEHCGRVFSTWEDFYKYDLKEMWVEVVDPETGKELEKIIFEKKYVPKEEEHG